MSDTLRIETDYCGFTAYYDPEGPIGRGKTREEALVDLLESCDNLHRTTLLAGSIVALMPTKVMDRTVRSPDWIDFAIRDLCEIPNRDSPEDFPEAMIVTPAEVRQMIERHLPSASHSQELSRRKCCTDPACPVRND